MTTFLVTTAFVLFLAVWLLSSVIKTIERIKGHDRCYACKNKLKYSGGYASVCAKCGRTQPWAQ